MLLLLGSLAHAQQPPECPFGVNTHQAPDEALDLAAAAGIGWVRFDFNWFQFEPQQDVYDWSVPDRFVDHATALGLNVYVSIGYTPEWAAGRACDDTSPNEDDHCKNRIPANRADWEDFVRVSVQRYGDRVKHWGVWNEPNLSGFFEGTREQWVSEILIPAADVIHAECADCAVVGPELAHLRGAHWDSDQGVCVLGECSFNGWDYSLRQILQDAGGVFDIISHHKYSDPADAWWDELLYGESILGVQYVHGVREITDSYAPGKPVWITEFGWESTPGGDHDPVYVADQLGLAYGALPAIQSGAWPASPVPWPELQKLFWYDLTDDPVVHPWGAYTWGLLDASYVPKPAYTAYADVITDLGGCAAFLPAEPGTPTDTGTPTGPGTGPTTTPPDTDDPSPTDPGPIDTGPDAPADPDGGEEPGGCGCRVPGSPATGGWLALGLLALRRRRR